MKKGVLFFLWLKKQDTKKVFWLLKYVLRILDKPLFQKPVSAEMCTQIHIVYTMKKGSDQLFMQRGIIDYE